MKVTCPSCKGDGTIDVALDRVKTTLPEIMPRVNGKSFYCDCGCNVFRHPIEIAMEGVAPENTFICNSCHQAYEGKK